MSAPSSASAAHRVAGNRGQIAANLPVLGATRFDLKYGMGGLPHRALMTNIDLYGTQVIPRVRELLT